MKLSRGQDKQLPCPLSFIALFSYQQKTIFR